MPFYGRDFFFDEQVKLFSLRQYGLYLYLLWHQWEHGTVPCYEVCRRFPAFMSDQHDDFILDPSTKTASREQTSNELKQVIRLCFEPHPTLAKRFWNTRLESIRSEQLKKDQVYQERARKGGVARSNQQASFKHSASSTPQASNELAIVSSPQAQPKLAIQREIKRERQRKTLKTPIPPEGAVEVVTKFDDFWKAYPARNGKKLEKEESRLRFENLSSSDQALAVIAARNFAGSIGVTEGRGIRDPKRFLRDGKDREFWREWIIPEQPPVKKPSILEQTLTWRPPEQRKAEARHDRSNLSKTDGGDAIDVTPTSRSTG